MYTQQAHDAAKIKFDARRVIARRLTDERREEIYAKIPEIKDIDLSIAKTGSKLVRIALSSKHDTDSEVERVKTETKQLAESKRQLLQKFGYAPDYMEDVYQCKKCRDTGYTGSEMCSCMKNELSAYSYVQAEVAAAIKSVGFSDINLDFYDGEAKAQAKFVLDECMRFVSNFESNDTKSMLIFGNTGVGKTFFSAACANYLIKKGYSVIYYSAQRLFTMLVDARFGKQQADDVYGCDLLIIDDLGSEMINNATVACFFELLNSRMLDGKKMIINTNLNFKQIETIYSSRILSRFMEFKRLALTGDDIRVKKQK